MRGGRERVEAKTPEAISFRDQAFLWILLILTVTRLRWVRFGRAIGKLRSERSHRGRATSRLPTLYSPDEKLASRLGQADMRTDAALMDIRKAGRQAQTWRCWARTVFSFGQYTALVKQSGFGPYNAATVIVYGRGNS
jgi:hypothetical protein